MTIVEVRYNRLGTMMIRHQYEYGNYSREHYSHTEVPFKSLCQR
jgi:hypothetical protein